MYAVCDMYVCVYDSTQDDNTTIMKLKYRNLHVSKINF